MLVSRLNRFGGFLLLFVFANCRQAHLMEDPDQGISKIKPNVTLCCENPRAILSYGCLTEQSNYTYSPKMNITVRHENDSFISINDFNNFHIVYGISCENPYSYDPEENEEDYWVLNENGSVFTEANNELIPLGQYCLHPEMSKIKPYEYTYKLHACPIMAENTPFDNIKSYLMTISIICMILTTVIYIFMGKRTNHQTLFLVYLIFLSIGFSTLVINSSFFIEQKAPCLALGYIGYFAVMAAFIILTVICVSMWNNFRGSNFYGTHLKSKRQLIIGLFCSLGGASLLTLGIVVAENSSIDDEWKAQIGVFACWVYTAAGYSRYIYLYGPMLLLILVNLVMFVLTTIRIFKLKKEVSRVTNSKSSPSVPNQFGFGKEFGLYLRIFFTMGTTWILEILNAINNQDESVFSIMSDVINACQGIILFVMFGNVQLIYKRFMRKTTADTESSSTQVTAIRQISTSSTASTKPLLLDKNA